MRIEGSNIVTDKTLLQSKRIVPSIASLTVTSYVGSVLSLFFLSGTIFLYLKYK